MPLVSGGGGGFTPVSCLLARDANFNIRLDSADSSVRWDALYDNFWDLNPLAAIPSGLGLTFAHDGSSGLIVPTVAGVWSLSYSATRAPDISWAGSLSVGGINNYPWVQQLSVGGSGNGTPYFAASITAALPAGTQITHNVAPVTEATAATYVCTQVYLSIVRHA